MSYNGEFHNDFKVAAGLGKEILPVLNSYFKRMEIIHSECLDESIAQLIDKYSGIDAVLKRKSDVSGIALRIQQHSNKNWKTFTIRYSRNTNTETEYSKRKRQIYSPYNDTFYPHYTCQAYLDKNNKLLGGAFCLTRDLFDITIPYEPFKKKGEEMVYVDTNGSDLNTFIVVPFVLIKRILYFPESKEEFLFPSEPERAEQLTLSL